MINMVDEFIIYDDVQFTKNDWRNRNRIKTVQGVKWLTIPVYHSINQNIREIKISDKNWNRKHWGSLMANYSKAKFFQNFKDQFEELFMSETSVYLSEINCNFISFINSLLGINTKISRSSDYNLKGNRTERLVGLCKQAGASAYLSGPAARNYLDVKLFEEENIQVNWMDYSGYPEYIQLHPPFEHSVSIIDMLFNLGSETNGCMKSFNK